MPDRGAEPRLRWVVDQLELQIGHRVVEIGGGHGVAATAVLERIGPDGRYLGIDRSAKMTAAAAARNAVAVAEGRARFEEADLLAASVRPGRQDRVFACRVAALAQPAPLAAVLGWLVPGGTLLLAFDDPDPARTTLHVERVLALAGELRSHSAVRRAAFATGEVVAVELRSPT